MLDGTYFFVDYCSAQIWSLKYDGNNLSEYTDRTRELESSNFVLFLLYSVD